MKQYDIAIHYAVGSDDHFIFDRMGQHWETTAGTVEEFIDELIAESNDECNIAHDIKDIVMDDTIKVYAYAAGHDDVQDMTELKPEMYL
jgi:hypothetical protein